MRSTIFLTRLVAVVFVVSFAISCTKNDSLNPEKGTVTTTPKNNYTPPAVAFYAPVQGFVIDDLGNPVNNAEVRTGSKISTTDSNGYFKIIEAPFTGDFCYVKAIKKGFFTGSVTIQGKNGGVYSTDIVLMSQNDIQVFDATQGKTITLQSGAEVKLPTNGYVTTAGKTYKGNVNVAIAHLYPDAKNFSSLIPGGDLRAFSADGKNVQLYSYGMLNVELRDDAGNMLQLADGHKAELTMPLTTSMVSSAPTTIPLWYFDEDKGIWIEEGAATLQDNKYVGSVAHFTSWNCDKPSPPSKVRGKVVGNDGSPLPFVKLRVDQRIVNVDDKGEFVALALANSKVNIDVYDELTRELMGANITVQAPQSDEVKDIGDIVLTGASVIKGEVVNCNGDPFTGYAFIKYNGYRNTVCFFNGKCAFRITNTGGEAELSFLSPGLSSKTVKKINIPNVPQTVDFGSVTVCGQNGINTRIYFSYQIGNSKPINVGFSLSYENYFKNNGTYSNIYFSDEVAGDSSSIYYVSIGFDDDKPGQFFYPYTNFIYRNKVNRNVYLNLSKIQLIIDKYGNIGEKVSGTFSGTEDDVTISNGYFETTRIE